MSLKRPILAVIILFISICAKLETQLSHQELIPIRIRGNNIYTEINSERTAKSRRNSWPIIRQNSPKALRQIKRFYSKSASSFYPMASPPQAYPFPPPPLYPYHFRPSPPYSPCECCCYAEWMCYSRYAYPYFPGYPVNTTTLTTPNQPLTTAIPSTSIMTPTTLLDTTTVSTTVSIHSTTSTITTETPPTTETTTTSPIIPTAPFPPIPWPMIQPSGPTPAGIIPIPWPIIQPAKFPVPCPIQPIKSPSGSFPVLWPIIQPNGPSESVPWPIIQPEVPPTKSCSQIVINSCPNCQCQRSYHVCNCNNPAADGSKPPNYGASSPNYSMPPNANEQLNELPLIVEAPGPLAFPSSSSITSSTYNSEDDGIQLQTSTSTEDEASRTKFRRDHLTTTTSSETAKVVKQEFSKITSNAIVMKPTFIIPLIISFLACLLSMKHIV